MTLKISPQDRQQILIDWYRRYLFNEITQGELLLYLRKNILGLSQQKYAELVGISRRTLTDIEQNKGSQTQQIIDKVFKPLGLKAGLTLTHEHVVHKLFE
ncbi:helix-turn-helix domain-containing protein [Acinetobacter ihumii]|uniref:helix-turn-helix domain-containing protein n=1 Tax=Acinetobacter ihumii TaxID=2483802 RepID=UPI0010302167|nr:helix-turn-helix domain-containing protein [Acinetobacter ihumii]